jgi:heme/copper-type cytochrome/quinol oxidase subunit 2
MNPAQTPQLDLRDIKPITEIPDTSLYLFILLVLIGLLVLGIIIYGLYRFYKSRNEVNLKKEYLKRLKQVDLTKSRSAAYEITKCAHYFAEHSEKHHQKANELIAQLSKYKYKRTVSAFDNETVSQYKLFVELISSE